MDSDAPQQEPVVRLETGLPDLPATTSSSSRQTAR
jgi:hypothetical protein